MTRTMESGPRWFRRVLLFSAAIAIAVATLSTAAAAKPERSIVYPPVFGCQTFTFNLSTAQVTYDGANRRFRSGTYRTASGQSCNGGKVQVWLTNWIYSPPPDMLCGYWMPVRYTLSGDFIANGVPQLVCPGGPPRLLGTYSGNSRLGFRWWNANSAHNHDQSWAMFQIVM